LFNMVKTLDSFEPGRRSASLVIDGRTVPVALRRNRNARRIILKLDPKTAGVVLTVPWNTSFERALDFAASQAAWIWAQSHRLVAPVPLRPGSRVPLRGVEHAIVRRDGARRPVWTEAGDPPQLCVSGDPAHCERRTTDWLKAQARHDLRVATRAYTARMGVRFTSLAVRDTRSRWGSCSSTGALSYSWRLVLAPAFVLDYVAAHEVAHLIEMNHSRAFWELVEVHCQRAGEARRWLKANGRGLHRYGAAG
jgi:predicted metal-dependent hydrolase